MKRRSSKLSGQRLEASSAQCDDQHLYSLLQSRVAQSPDAIAITAPGRLPLTYRCLLDQIQSHNAALRNIGVTSSDRVAMVLPNGPEMAAAFLSVSCCATSAPLNPAYRAHEFEFYLSDLNAKALLAQNGID